MEPSSEKGAYVESKEIENENPSASKNIGHGKHDTTELDILEPDNWLLDYHRDYLIKIIDKKYKKCKKIVQPLIKMVLSIIPGQKIPNQKLSDPETPSNQNQCTDTIRDPWDGPMCRVYLAHLQNVWLRKLQCTLVKDVVDMRFRGVLPKMLGETLQQYVQGIRDLEFMTTYSQKSELDNPFIVTAKKSVDFDVLSQALKGVPNIGDPNWLAELSTKKSDKKVESIGGSAKDQIRRSQVKEFLYRLGLAVLGGAFLVGPMWWMVLHRTLYTTLISTTALVATFGIIMAYFLEDGNAVLSSTAAYAAVLVVFVGLNTAPKSAG